MNSIEKLGFTKNTKTVLGYKPHYTNGNDYLFIIGPDYGPSKICSIHNAFKRHLGKVYGILSEKSPRMAKYDWITFGLILIELNPLGSAQWKADGSDIEFIPTKLPA